MNIRGMYEELGKRIKSLRNRLKMNQTAFAREMKVEQPTISRWENGEVYPERANLIKLAEMAGVSVPEFEFGTTVPSGSRKLVPVVGRIGAGAIVNVIDSDTSAIDYTEPPPTFAADGLLAYEIDGHSMPPFKPGNKVFARSTDAGIPAECLNEMCILALTNGTRFLKILRRGYEAGTYNLHSLNGEPPIENVDLAWAARVVGATF